MLRYFSLERVAKFSLNWEARATAGLSSSAKRTPEFQHTFLVMFILPFFTIAGQAAPAAESSDQSLQAAGQAAATVDLQEDGDEAKGAVATESEQHDDADQANAADERTSDDEESDEASGDAHDDEDDANDDGEDEGEQLDLHEVKRRDLKVEVELDGVFVADEMKEVALRPEVWTDFKVVAAVDHGARVRKGDVLVEFDDRKFEQTLAQKSVEQRIGELTLMQAEEELPRAEKAVELNFTQAKRAYELQQDDYKRFQETVRPMSEKLATQNLASSQFSLESAQEELEQLQQMYEADELTEETEEIVLKRQRFAVERAELYLESAKINYDQTMNIMLPRRDETYALNLQATELAFEQAKMNQSLGMSRQRYELEKLRENRVRSVDEHAKLVADRTMMKLRAPIDGVVYYGRCVDGKFAEVGNLKNKLVPFGSISANTVVMTVVQDGPMHVKTEVSESDFPSLQRGQSAEVAPAADDDSELAATVDQITGIPQEGNKFAVTLEVDLDDAPEWLVPGMTCKAQVTTYEVEDAVVIPSELVQTDEDDEDAKYVMVLGEDDERVRRDVELGEEEGDDVEILEGLDEGDKIIKGAKEDEDEEDDNGDDDDEDDDD